MTNVSKNFTGQSLRIWRINSHHLIVTRLTRWLYHILITIRGQMVHKRPDKESKHGRDMLCVTRPASSSHNTNPILPGPGLVVVVPPCQAPGSPRPPAKVPHFQFSHQTTSRGQSRAPDPARHTTVTATPGYLALRILNVDRDIVKIQLIFTDCEIFNSVCKKLLFVKI